MENKKNNAKRSSVMLFAIFLATLLITGCMQGIYTPPYGNGDEWNTDLSEFDGSLKRFESIEEYTEFIESSSSGDSSSNNLMGGAKSSGVAMDVMEESVQAPRASDSDDGSASSTSASGTSDYSGTNIQVEGVDEADIVKTDGEYIYYVANSKLYIVKAYPADDAEIISELNIDDVNPNEIFINDDKLVMMGYEYKRDESDSSGASSDVARIMPYPYYPRTSYTFIRIFDISDKEDPIEEENILVEGSYYDSRMIGDYAYIIINQWTGSTFEPPVIYYKGGERTIPVTDIYYFDMPDTSRQLSTIMAVDLNDNSFTEKTILKGYSQNVYVSEDNIYLTNQKQIPYYHEEKRIIEEVMMDILPSDVQDEIQKIQGYDLRESTKINEIQYIIAEYAESLDPEDLEELTEEIESEVQEIQEEIARERQKTIIHRISIDGSEIEHEAQGEVQGTPLNQFSIDEDGDYFRIATTINNWWSDEESANNLYVLDMDLDIVGEIEDIAPGERIYSVRFMQDRAYMVTFRTIDPLFVIGLEDPEDPEILGQLKIPGYSDYLHPYDENHIIGIGKSTEEDKENDRAWQQGIKMSLFDVSDVENPKEIANVEIGDRGTDSDALYNHKAFLFDREKNLLVLPIRVAEIDSEKYVDEEEMRWAYGDFIFQGAYVYGLTPEDGFDLRGKITHLDSDDDLLKSGYYFYSDKSIVRSLYIDDVLYTLSETRIMANDLSDDLEEIETIDLPVSEKDDEIYPVVYEEDVAVRKETTSSGASIDVDDAEVLG
ncbi:MAG: beta-propeller domain-containing protein [Candidatus Woesearchaeota archaeon]